MNHLLRIFVVFMMAGIASQICAEKEEKHGTPPPPSFNQLKALVGKWEGSEMKNGKKQKVYTNYKLTSGGTAIQETLFPGTPYEMVSIYYGDDEDLVMTHYCMLGNQPHLRLTEQEDPAKMVFEFVDATNLKSSKDMHMHGLTITFLDKNHIQEDWVCYTNGEQCSVKILKFSRVK